MTTLVQDLQYGSLRLRCRIDYSPEDPGRLSGPPEDCYPPEPEEFEITELLLQLPDKSWLEITPLLLEEIINPETLTNRARAALEQTGFFNPPYDPD